ncbi:hypothetical protein GFY24_36580 [Nocardia sp. SYP-A9097]|uniref:hypothetical protein n=1 Tax=Nocardia sp. SYP-A9097 TaxID=2663237 RepID=UPI00129B78D3|nr:hypothetical protein [Nocardia sp. SYP-A9097]MRH92874.1 hypothetical protein [Nocardia sp. SYP-A9097]
MTTINALENAISHLELTELAHTTVSEHAVVQVIDPRRLAVVMFCGDKTQIIEDAIRSQRYNAKELTTTHDIITITI